MVRNAGLYFNSSSHIEHEFADEMHKKTASNQGGEDVGRAVAFKNLVNKHELDILRVATSDVESISLALEPVAGFEILNIHNVGVLKYACNDESADELSVENQGFRFIAELKLKPEALGLDRIKVEVFVKDHF